MQQEYANALELEEEEAAMDVKMDLESANVLAVCRRHAEFMSSEISSPSVTSRPRQASAPTALNAFSEQIRTAQAEEASDVGGRASSWHTELKADDVRALQLHVNYV